MSAAARRSTPRPSYDGPAVVRPPEVTHHLWGDADAGYVGDEVLVSSAKLHALIFTLPPGGKFRHSLPNRTVFGADEVYFVLDGVLALANPETGEVVRAEAGEAVFFRRDTWHHGFNRSTGALHVLEIFAPPPAAGMSSAYAATRPYLTESRYAQDEVLGRWPMDRAAIEATNTLHLVGSADQRYRIEGDLLTGLVASTEQLTVLSGELLPGQASEFRSHPGDAVCYVTAGEVHVHTPDAATANWWRVRTGDAFVLPGPERYRLVNQGAEPARFVLGAAPRYLS
jgi:quercetin dioxygenase-like cupin family protein/mannose-6-phosphate isomerase-like protein (cupin superfamily)